MSGSPATMRDACIERLHREARMRPELLILSNDFGAPALDRFRGELPGQFINMAIAEQNMVAVAAGLALAGKKVYLYGIAPFVTLRCLEQIRIDLCAMKLPVTILGVGAGYAYDVDGPTHHALEDIAGLRPLPNLTLFSPSTARVAAGCAELSLGAAGPVYIRLDRTDFELPCAAKEYEMARGLELLRPGADLLLIATGIMVQRALEVAGDLAGVGIEAAVVDFFRLKPVNLPVLGGLLGSFPLIVSLEEHALQGGLGSLVAEAAADLSIPVRLKRLGVCDDQLYAYGTRAQLHWGRGLDRARLCEMARAWVEELRQGSAKRG